MTTEGLYEVNDAQPQVIEHFIGNQRVVKQVKNALEATYNCPETRFPHALLQGISGGGKSQLSSIIAREKGCILREQLALNLNTPAEMRGFLLSAQEGEFLLIDETHQLKEQVLLYRALEEKKLFINSKFSKKVHCIELANFTLLAATTDPHMLLKPLRDRFRLVLNFDYYDLEELATIVRNRSKQLGWACENEVFALIAERARNTPRIALGLMESAKRTCRAENVATITVEMFRKSCDLEGVDDCGLGIDERKYLSILAEHHVPVRLNVIATRMGLPPKSVVELLEKFLIRIGFVMKDDKGRFLTETGRHHIDNNPV